MEFAQGQFVPVSAQQEGLIGVWKLKSFVVENVKNERRKVFGETPSGYIVITPERFMVIISAEGRKPPENDADRLFSFSTVVAYTGLYLAEGNRLTTQVDVAWNEAWNGTAQIRFFRLEGDKLYIESALAPLAVYPELGPMRGILEWERSK